MSSATRRDEASAAPGSRTRGGKIRRLAWRRAAPRGGSGENRTHVAGFADRCLAAWRRNRGRGPENRTPPSGFGDRLMCPASVPYGASERN